jgi:hypothetical protein
MERQLRDGDRQCLTELGECCATPDRVIRSFPFLIDHSSMMPTPTTALVIVGRCGT